MSVPYPARRRRGATYSLRVEDARREHRGVLRVVDADARDRHARRHLRDREQRVEPAADRHRRGERDADDRQLRVSGDDTRQRRGQPGAGDDHPQATHLRVLRVVGDGVGVAVRRHHAHLVADTALVELLGRLLHRRHVALGAHDDADARGVDLHAVELGLDGGLGGHFSFAHAFSAMSWRSWRPSKVIMSAAAYAASRAARTSSPSAVTLSTRPPAVTIAPPDSAVPAWSTSTAAGTASSPEITSPEEEDSG